MNHRSTSSTDVDTLQQGASSDAPVTSVSEDDRTLDPLPMSAVHRAAPLAMDIERIFIDAAHQRPPDLHTVARRLRRLGLAALLCHTTGRIIVCGLVLVFDSHWSLHGPGTHVESRAAFIAAKLALRATEVI